MAALLTSLLSRSVSGLRGLVFLKQRLSSRAAPRQPPRWGLPSTRLYESAASLYAHNDGKVTPVPLTNFSGPAFHIPPYITPLPLETMNKHVLDSNIRFEEKGHKYYYEGKPMDRSVTALVDSFFGKFDADDAIAKMKKGNNWPRAEYMTKGGKVWTDEQIKTSWDMTGENARNRGTYLHWNIERIVNGYAACASDGLPELKQFLDFYDEVVIPQKITPFRSEWRIAAPDLSLAGSVDFVGKEEGGDYVIMDWKRSKKLPTTLDNKYGKRGLPPLTHLDDCEGAKYSLQLNVYRYILQKYYGISVSKMILASFHPSLSGYFMISVPVMEAEVEAILGLSSREKKSSSAPTTVPQKRPFV